jgi:hypothetical protein
MYEVAQIINSRPLFTIDNQIITPAHFTAGRPLIQLPPVGGDAMKEFSPTLIEITRHQKKVNGFWRNWLKSYLMQLPSAHKNTKQGEHNLAIGDVILLNAPTNDRMMWPIGTITKVFHSGDGIVRSAELKTTNEDGEEKTLVRSTNRMVLLEAANERLPAYPSEPIQEAEDVTANDSVESIDTDDDQ